MCYLLREPDASLQSSETAPARPGPSVRPRWVAAAGMALAATVAVAALVTTPPAQAPQPVKQATGLVPVANRTTVALPTSDVQRTALPADDDVPTSSGTMRAGIGHCHEGL